MQALPSPSISSLLQQRIQMQQGLYKKLFLYIMISNVVFIIIEIIQAILSDQPDRLLTFVFLLAFIVIISAAILQIKKGQDLFITIFIGLYYLCGLVASYKGDLGYFEHQSDLFNYTYALALFERLVIARIPRISYNIIFSVCITMIRAIIVSYKDIEVFLMQIVYVGFGIYLDLGREKQAQRVIRTHISSRKQLEKFKNLVVNDIPDNIAIISQDLSQCLFANNAFSALCDISSNSNIQGHFNQFKVYEEDNSQGQLLSGRSTMPPRKTLLSFIESTMSDPDFLADRKFSCHLTFNQIANSSQGEISSNRIFESKVFQITWDEIPAIAIILHDITQQHTIISLKVADAQKDTLLATVSHELRTPLNGMLGMIQVLQKRTQDSESLKYLKICKNSGNLLMGLVNSILDFNQIRAKKLKLNPEKVNLYQLLKDMVQLFELQCAQKGISIKLNISPSVPKHVVTDPNRLTQIFINLVGNALKFTMKGGITISAKEFYDRRLVQLGVEDTGIGIKDEDKDKLFKMFGRIEHKDSRTNQQGVGLGLTISDNLARLLGGEEQKEGIRLESVYGEGSIFSFWIKTDLLEQLPNQENDDSSLVTRDESLCISEKIRDYTMLNKIAPTFKRFKPLGDISPSISQSFKEKTQATSCLSNKILHISELTSKSAGHVRTLKSQLENYVLIVDDNPFNITVAEYLVSSHGYKVKTALYGETAIDIMLKNNHDIEPIRLVLMDCLMPVMDGYETTRMLKKLMGQKKIPEIPIVALTANNSETDKEASIKAGMCEHLTKPLKEVDLFKVLNKYVI